MIRFLQEKLFIAKAMLFCFCMIAFTPLILIVGKPAYIGGIMQGIANLINEAHQKGFISLAQKQKLEDELS